VTEASVDLDPTIVRELTPPCRFGHSSLETNGMVVSCGRPVTHAVFFACGDAWPACEMHAEWWCDHETIVVLCQHGVCGIARVEKL
jgi:hypothetical protein